MSMLKGKAGFVIPKNKFSGSLVPIFKKSQSNDTASEDSGKQQQRKTKWGPDLTQDTTVNKGRALAYQTRVDQITQQLKLGSLRNDDQKSRSAGDFPDSEVSIMQIEFEKLQSLELERREAIGEILKLNPAYKVPPGYQAVVREVTVPIPVKEYPDCNFLGLVCGSDGETQKRLEKDTGTRLKVYGTKSETGEKVEITPSDGSVVVSSCDEVYVQISADTYEKVDAAASLIELLLNSVLVKTAAAKASDPVSGDNSQVLGKDSELVTDGAASTAMASQETVRPMTGTMLTFSQGPFQSYPNPWFPGGQSNSPSGPAPVPSSMGFQFNPSNPRPLFGPGPPAPYGFGSSPQGNTNMPPRLHQPNPVLRGTFMPPAFPIGQTGHPRSFSAVTSPSPLAGHHPSLVGSPRVAASQVAERSMTPSVSSSGWAMPGSGTQQSLASSAPRSAPPHFASPQAGPPSHFPSQFRSSPPVAVQPSFAPQAQLNSSTNTMLRPSPVPVPPPSASHAPHSGMPGPAHGYRASFTPLKPTGPAAQGPQFRGSGDFDFQPHLPQGPPSQSLSGPGMHFMSQRPTQVQLPPAPQVPSFRPAMQNTIQQSVRQNFPRSPGGNHMGPPSGQFGPPSQNPHMGPRNHGQVPQISNAAPFPPRGGHGAQFLQSHPAPPLTRPGGMFAANQHSGPGRPQVYDPFFPSSVRPAQPQGSNTGITRKQDSDPEYEDLMASVGVK